MRVFLGWTVLNIWWLFTPLAVAFSADYKVVEQSTNQGTFYAYHNQNTPSWWHMAMPDVAYYAYNSNSTRFYIRPAQSSSVYTVNLVKRLDKLPAAQMRRQDVKGIEIAEYSDLRQWQVHVYNKFCGSVLASKNAAQDLKLNFVDQVRISQGLRTAFSQDIDRNKPCDDFHIPAVMGRLVGYGLALEGRTIKSDVTSINEANDLPENYLTVQQTASAHPLTPEGRLTLLLATLPPQERLSYEKMTGDKPPESIIRAIKARYSQKN